MKVIFIYIIIIIINFVIMGGAKSKHIFTALSGDLSERKIETFCALPFDLRYDYRDIVHPTNCAHRSRFIVLLIWYGVNGLHTIQDYFIDTRTIVYSLFQWSNHDIDGLAQDCSNSIALAMKLLPSICKLIAWI